MLLEDFDPLIDDLTKLRINLRFIITMTARTDEAGTLADEALVFVGPFNDLDIAIALIHDRDSSIFVLTSRSC